MIGILFVIPTRIEQPSHVEVLQRAIDSIRKHFGPTTYILIVDSDSPCRDHVDIFKDDFYTTFADVHNKNYEAGAWLYAYNTYKARRYVFMHDSCEVMEDFSDVFDKELTIWNSHESWKYITHRQQEWVTNQLKFTPWKDIPEEFTMVQGSIFTVTRPVLDKLYTRGLEKILPNNKDEAMGFERLLGIVLTIEGYEPLMKRTALKPRLTKLFAGRR